MRIPRFLRVAWQHWKRLAEKIGHFQARLLFTIIYFVVVAPFAVALKILADPLGIRKRPLAPNWRSVQRQTLSIEDAHRQF